MNADGAGDCSDDNLLLTEEHEAASSHQIHRSVISLDSMESHGPINGGSSARREVFRRLKAPRNPVMPVNHHKVIVVIRKKERITLEEKVMQELKDYQNVII